LSESSWFDIVPFFLCIFFAELICHCHHGFENIQAAEIIPTIPVKTSKSVLSNKCDFGWYERPFSSSCYLIKETKVTFREAKNNCNQENAELITIISAEEQLYIQSTRKNFETIHIVLAGKFYGILLSSTTINIVFLILFLSCLDYFEKQF
jgi:hypothetical protein